MTTSNDAITDYWLKHYLNKDLCGLCAQSGVIDTTGIRSPAGVECGGQFYCICPNGQSMREHGAVLPRIVRIR